MVIKSILIWSEVVDANYFVNGQFDDILLETDFKFDVQEDFLCDVF